MDGETALELLRMRTALRMAYHLLGNWYSAASGEHVALTENRREATKECMDQMRTLAFPEIPRVDPVIVWRAAAMKFRKKPVIVEAWQNVLGNKIPDWPGFQGHGVGMVGRLIQFTNHLHSSNLAAEPGDWIINAGNGDFYPCKPDVFEKTYERVDG